MDQLEKEVIKVTKESKERWDQQELKVLEALMDIKAHKVKLDQQELEDLEEKMDTKEFQEMQDL